MGIMSLEFLILLLSWWCCNQLCARARLAFPWNAHQRLHPGALVSTMVVKHILRAVCRAVEFVDTPDFFGPGNSLRGAPARAPTFADRARLLTPPSLQPAAADANFATT